MLANDRVYFDNAYREYSKTLYRIAVMAVRKKAEAEDCVSEVFCRLIRHGNNFKSCTHEKAWLIRVTINICKNKNRDYFNRNTILLEDVYPYTEKEFEKVEFVTLIEKLKPKEGVAIYLRYCLDMPSKDIAKVLKLSDGGVRTLLHRAKAVLKLEYENENKE